MNCRMLLIAVAALVAWASSLEAVTSYPMVMSIRPVAIQVGTTAELTVRSRYSMDGFYRVLVSGTGVTGEVTESRSKPEPPPKPSTKKKAKSKTQRTTVENLAIRFHVDKDALPGVRDFRVAGAQGVSTAGQLVVVQDPVVTESGDNDTPEKAQKITVPAVVCGSIEKSEDRDYFKFHVEAGRSLVFRVRGMTLEDRIHDLQLHLDPIITLRSSTGATIAVCDNDISGDPLLCHRFERAGDYTLEIRDVRYKGDRDWVYCVEISDRPFLRTAFPLAVAPGQHVTLRPIGFQIPEKSAIDWIVPTTWDAGIHDAQLPLAGRLTNTVALVATHLPIVMEPAGEHSSSKNAPPVSIPVAINGRIEKEAEADRYSFPAKKGELLTFDVFARRAGSPLDSAMRILDAKGRVLTEGDDQNDFGRSTADATIENWRAPADGTYTVEIRDLLQRGDADFVYVLTIAKPEPEFEVFIDTDKTELAPGTSGVLFVNCIRKNGFDGEIALAVEGLPEGVKEVCDRIPPGHRDGCIILTAAAGAKPEVANIRVIGTGRQKLANGRTAELHASGRPLQETYLPGGGRGHWSVESHAVAVSEPSDLRGVKLDKQSISLKPGASARVDVTIERAPDFTENVTLSPRFEPLGRIYGDTLPKGVEVDAKRSKTLLTGKETHGFITFRATPTAEPMSDRPVAVMANVSINFVMKATYSSEPLFVTTLPRK